MATLPAGARTSSVDRADARSARREPRTDEPRLAEARGAVAFATLTVLASAAVIALVWLAFAPALEATAEAATWLAGRDELVLRASITTVLIASALLVSIWAWSRATVPTRPVRVAGGRGTIAMEQIAAWVRDELETRIDIRQAGVTVVRQGKGVRVAARIAVTPDARIAETTVGANALIEQVLASQVGVRQAKPPLIEVRYEELRLRPRRFEQMQDTTEYVPETDA